MTIKTHDSQCRQTVRAGHRCSHPAKTDGFCDMHWLKRFGHLFNAALICKHCRQAWEKVESDVCLMNPYIDQPATTYPEPV